MQRRRFIEICVAGAATCQGSPSTAEAVRAIGAAPIAPQRHERVKLVDANRNPLKAASLRPGVNYVFNYPFATTPCFLLCLDGDANEGVSLHTEAGQPYTWAGGVGPGRRIVAYSAICAHKLAYPSPQVSFISYRDKPSPIHPRGKVIGCCADKSVYDPYAGAKVMSGPAPQPLAAILLEHDAGRDELYAIGTAGGEKFKEFFDKYEFKLTLETGSGNVRNKVSGSAIVKELARVSQQTAQC
jgi:Rieske Fe-S protein